MINGQEADKLRSILLRRADLAQFDAERTVGELRGAEIEVARSDVTAASEENIAAVRESKAANCL